VQWKAVTEAVAEAYGPGFLPQVSRLGSALALLAPLVPLTPAEGESGDGDVLDAEIEQAAVNVVLAQVCEMAFELESFVRLDAELPTVDLRTQRGMHYIVKRVACSRRHARATRGSTRSGLSWSNSRS
jgi:hypothetical protein